MVGLSFVGWCGVRQEWLVLYLCVTVIIGQIEIDMERTVITRCKMPASLERELLSDLRYGGELHGEVNVYCTVGLDPFDGGRKMWCFGSKSEERMISPKKPVIVGANTDSAHFRLYDSCIYLDPVTSKAYFDDLSAGEIFPVWLRVRRVLHLTLKKQWYDLIASGVKPEEYRDFTPYYIKRLCVNPVFNREGAVVGTQSIDDYTLQRCKEQGIDLKKALTDGNMVFGDFDDVCFHLGYSKTTMTYQIDRMLVGTGREEWGAEPGKDYFVIKFSQQIA